MCGAPLPAHTQARKVFSMGAKENMEENRSIKMENTTTADSDKKHERIACEGYKIKVYSTHFLLVDNPIHYN